MVNRDLIDASLLLLTMLATPAYAFFLYRHPMFCQKKGFIFFLVFLAMYPLLNMLAHIVAVSTFAIIDAGKGVFTFNFYFYGLILYGLVFSLINLYLLHQIKLLSQGKWRACRQVYYAAALQIILILPSFLLNPLALLPSLTSIIMITRLYVAQRKRKSTATYISAGAA